AQEGDVLDTFAVERAQEFVDLPAAGPSLLVQRDADLAVGRSHRLAGEAGIFALDIEIADFAETGEPLVEIGPVGHAPTVDIVGQVIDRVQPGPGRPALRTGFVDEVYIVDRWPG